MGGKAVTAEVFKLQRPLGGNTGLALAYTRRRNRDTFVPYDNTIRALFERHGNPLKLYVRAELQDGALQIGDVLPPESW